MKRFRILILCAILSAAGTVAAFSQASAAGKGDATKGKDVFDSNCSPCHNADSEEKKVGPGLKGLFAKDKMSNGKKATDATVRERIDNGGNGMPAYKEILADSEKDDVIAYLKTL